MFSCSLLFFGTNSKVSFDFRLLSVYFSMFSVLPIYIHIHYIYVYILFRYLNIFAFSFEFFLIFLVHSFEFFFSLPTVRQKDDGMR